MKSFRLLIQKANLLEVKMIFKGRENNILQSNSSSIVFFKLKQPFACSQTQKQAPFQIGISQQKNKTIPTKNSFPMALALIPTWIVSRINEIFPLYFHKCWKVISKQQFTFCYHRVLVHSDKSTYADLLERFEAAQWKCIKQEDLVFIRIIKLFFSYLETGTNAFPSDVTSL